MPNVVFYNSYKLKKDSSVQDFLVAVEKLFNENISKFKGCISSKLLVDGETWADFSIWESMEDLQAFLASAQAAQENGTNDLAENFYSFIDFKTIKGNKYIVEKYF
jgi:quinol monooxygenase YgiN